MDKQPQLTEELIQEFVLQPEILAIVKKERPNNIGNRKYTEIDYGKQHPLYGTCHRLSAFWYWLNNGKDGYDVKLENLFINEELGNHTWCRHKDGRVVDLSSSQFDFDVEYDKGSTGSLITTRRLSGARNKKYTDIQYHRCVPSQLSIKLGRLLKEQVGSAFGLEYWINEQEEYWKRRDEYLNNVTV